MGSGDEEGVVELLLVQGLVNVICGEEEKESDEEDDGYGEGG